MYPTQTVNEAPTMIRNTRPIEVVSGNEVQQALSIRSVSEYATVAFHRVEILTATCPLISQPIPESRDAGRLVYTNRRPPPERVPKPMERQSRFEGLGLWPRWSLENRPIERTQNKSSYTLSAPIPANFGTRRPAGAYTDLTWAEYTATQGCGRPRGRNDGAAQAALPATFWRESAKSQGFGDRVPKDRCGLRKFTQNR